MRPTVEPFSTEQVCRLSGASFRQLDHWARLSTLVPSIREANGSGSQRRYSLLDAEIARVLVRLSVVLDGGTLARFGALVHTLRTERLAWLRPVLVGTDGSVAVLVSLPAHDEGCLVHPRHAREHVAAELQGLRAEETVRVLVG